MPDAKHEPDKTTAREMAEKAARQRYNGDEIAAADVIRAFFKMKNCVVRTG